MNLLRLLSALGHRGLDALFPPLCLLCEKEVAQAHSLCSACWKRIHWVAPPFCARCGAPFDLPVEADTLCAACLVKAPTYGLARSVFLYDEESKPLVLRFKHGDQLHGAVAFASWMARVGEAVWREAEIIVPVPLHRWRLFRRLYNQAAVLALALGARTGKPVCVDVLRRVRATPSQGRLSAKDRVRNVHGAFAVKKGVFIKGKAVLLVDDVMTTGATVCACAEALLAAGAARVDVLTLARVRGGE